MGLTDELHDNAVNNAVLFRPVFDGPLLSAAAYTPASAALAIEQKNADASLSQALIANPDLVQRISGNHPLNSFHRSTFCGGAEHSYTAYKRINAA